MNRYSSFFRCAGLCKQQAPQAQTRRLPADRSKWWWYCSGLSVNKITSKARAVIWRVCNRHW